MTREQAADLARELSDPTMEHCTCLKCSKGLYHVLQRVFPEIPWTYAEDAERGCGYIEIGEEKAKPVTDEVHRHAFQFRRIEMD